MASQLFDLLDDRIAEQVAGGAPGTIKDGWRYDMDEVAIGSTVTWTDGGTTYTRTAGIDKETGQSDGTTGPYYLARFTDAEGNLVYQFVTTTSINTKRSGKTDNFWNPTDEVSNNGVFTIDLR